MMHIIGQPRSVTGVAVSGGPDSMAALSFLRNGGHEVIALHFNHNTEHSGYADSFVTEYCRANDIPLRKAKISTAKNKELSWEQYWRIERYKFLRSHNDLVIATAHTLNDVAETYLFGAAHGSPGPALIPYRHKHIVRPFLLVPKTAMLRWCETRKVPYIEDPSNNDVRHTRNRIRHKVLPEILSVNPGFLTVIAKKVMERMSNETTQEVAQDSVLLP
jgi:tRNA(Ile)-lysidine synthase